MDAPGGDPQLAYRVMQRAVRMHLAAHLSPDDMMQVAPLGAEHLARFWLWLVAGRMRPGVVEKLWPDGFFHGVHGHDALLGNEAHFVLRLAEGGNASAGLA